MVYIKGEEVRILQCESWSLCIYPFGSKYVILIIQEEEREEEEGKKERKRMNVYLCIYHLYIFPSETGR